jgi:hypothetical protein
MNNHDGTWAYWCQGFVCTILDQTFSTIGEYFNEYYADTWTVEIMRVQAAAKKLFPDIKSFTKKTPFSQHILFIHILPPMFIKGFNHMGWLKTCLRSTNSPFSCFNFDKLKKKHLSKTG